MKVKLIILVGLFLSHAGIAQFRNTNRDYHPKWYPDGKSLVFYSYRPSQPGVYKVNIETGEETLITERLGSHPFVSPDGSKLVYCLPDDTGVNRLNIIDAMTGKALRVIDHKNAELHAFHPTWLPDGRIIFNAEKGEVSNLMIVNEDGTGLATIVEGIEAVTPSSYAGGDKVVFVASNGQPKRGIYTSDITGKNVELLIGHDSEYGTPDISPDESKLVFTNAQNGIRQVYVMDLSNRATKQLTFGSGDCYFPRWSPDGKQIAFATEAYGFSEIAVIDANGSKLRNITRNGVEHAKPIPVKSNEFFYLSKEKGFGQIVFSKRGAPLTGDDLNVVSFDIDQDEQFVYFSAKKESATAIYRLSIRNKKLMKLSDVEGDVLALSVSADRSQVAFELTTGDGSDIYLLDIDSGEISEIIVTGHDEGNPRFHSSSNTLIYNSNASGNYDLMSYDISTGESTVLVNSAKHEIYGDVSPDGNKVVFTSNGTNAWDIEMLDIETGERSSLVSLPNFDFYPKWTNSGDKVLFQSTSSGSTEVFEVDLNTKEIKQLTKQ